MKTAKTYAVVIAVSMTLGAAAQEQAQRNPGAGPNAARTERERIDADTAAMTVSPADQKAIRQALARVAEDGTAVGKFDDLMKAFTAGPVAANSTTRPSNAKTLTQRRQDNTSNARANPGGPGAETAASGAAALSRADFDSQVAQFQRDWKEKYHADFKLSANATQVFTDGFAQINTSDLGEAARTAGAKIGPTAGIENTTRTPAGQVNPNAQRTAPAGGNDNSRIDSRAVVLVEASHGAPMATLTLVKSQAGDWKLDTPQGVDEQRLRNHLARHLQMIQRDKANWPSDQNDAYRLVAHHVFLAIDDAGAGMMQGGSVVQPGEKTGTPDLRAPNQRR